MGAGDGTRLLPRLVRLSRGRLASGCPFCTIAMPGGPATLEAVHMPGLLRVRVTDDGCGGARVEARGGLAGLAERIRTVDGRLRLSSPPGGPSVITVELPSRA